MKKSLGTGTFAMPCPVWVIGSYNGEHQPNAMTVAWGGICCSQPPCVTISLRKATQTYHNLMARKAYTVNIPSEKFAAEADYCGMASGKKEDKFTVTGLTPVKSAIVDAPFIQEFPLILECRVIQTVEIGLHTQFIGEIIDVKADTDVLGEKGLPDIEKVRPFVYSFEKPSYHAVGHLIGKAFAIGKNIGK